MTTPKFSAMSHPAMMDIPGNDSRHNLPDSNRGGSPRHNPKHVAPAQRGGFGQHGQKGPAAPSGGGRSSSGNPASRGGSSIGSMTPNANIPGHGGSPAGQSAGLRSNFGGGFGQSGQQGVPSGSHANPQPASGNTSGRSYRLIAGRFKRAAMGAKGNQGSSGKYGSAPVTSNT